MHCIMYTLHVCIYTLCAAAAAAVELLMLSTIANLCKTIDCGKNSIVGDNDAVRSVVLLTQICCV